MPPDREDRRPATRAANASSAIAQPATETTVGAYSGTGSGARVASGLRAARKPATTAVASRTNRRLRPPIPASASQPSAASMATPSANSASQRAGTRNRLNPGKAASDQYNGL